MMAAVLALRLVRITGMRFGWISIAIGLSLMAWRRLIVFSDLYTGRVQAEQIAYPEILALVLSAFLFAGVATIGPYFRSLEENYRLRQESERKYRAVADLTYDWEYWLDEAMRFVYISPSCERLCGYTRSQLLEEPHLIDKIFESDSLAVYKQSLQKVLETKEAVNDILKINRQGNGIGFVRHIATAAYVDGQFCGIRGSFTDITEAHLAKQEVEQLNKELEQRVQRRTRQLQEANSDLEAFVYSVSHDLRAPLRHLDGFAAAIAEDYEDKLDAEGKLMLSRIRNASKEMNALIDGLLRLSRIASKELQKEWIDVSAIAASIIDEYRGYADTQEFQVDLQPGVYVYGDKALIQNIVQNLVDNSLKYSDKTRPCQIAIASIEELGYLGFSVIDNGIGFSSSEESKLFKVFSRLHPESKYPGTGIGLASVKRAVQRHEGKVWAESEEGKYAKFCVLLPTPESLGIEDPNSLSQSG